MANDILIIPASASIEFSGSAANTIRLQVEDSGSVAFYGNSGSLFGISDNLDGSLMSVNDISGLPTLETFSDGKLVVSPYAFQTRSMGFGTDTPIGNFDFVNPLAENVDFYIRTTQGSSYDTAIHIRGSRTTSTTDELANIRFETADTSAGGVEMARISAIKDVASTNIARLEFKTTSTDGASPTTKMMISASGNVGIGTTSPTHKLEIVGNVSASSYTGSFSGDGSQITGVVSASYAVTASHALNAGGGSGTITSITAGDGLNGGTITTSGTISVDSGSMLPYYSSSIFATVGGDGSIGADGTLTVNNDSHTHDANNLTGTTLNSGVVNSSLTSFGTVASGNVNAILPAGTLSSSAQIDGSQVTGVVSASYAVTASHALNAGGGGTPGGSDGQIQYNNGGSFGGAAQLYYDDGNDRVGIGTASPTKALDVRGNLLVSGAAADIIVESESPSVEFIDSNTNADSTGYSGYFRATGADTNTRGIFGWAGFNPGNSGYFKIAENQFGIDMLASASVARADNLTDFTIQPDGDVILGEAGGYVGLGTAPTVPLHIKYPTALSIRGERTGSIAAGNGIIQFQAYGNVGASGGINAASVQLTADQNWTDGVASGTRITFHTNPRDSWNADAEVMRIDHNGNVGIGTTDPEQLLSLVDSAGEVRIQMESSGTPRNNYIGITGHDNIVIAADEDNAGGSSTIQFRIDADEKMRIAQTGLVGIGTTSPGELLHLSASGDANIRLENNGNGNTSAIEFFRERLNGPASRGAWIGIESNTSTNNTDLYIDTSTAVGAPGDTTLGTNNGRIVVRGASSPSVSLYAGTAGPEVRLTTAGLGINRTSPGVILHVSSSNAQLARFEGAESANHGYIEYYITGRGGRQAYMGFGSSGTTDFTINNEAGGSVRIVPNTVLGGTSNNTLNVTTIGGFAVEDGVVGGTRFGSYGVLHLYSNTNLTAGARQYYITNAINGNTFGIIRSTSGTTTPSIDGASGGVDSGTVDFAIDNTGNVGIGITDAGTAKFNTSGSAKFGHTSDSGFTASQLGTVDIIAKDTTQCITLINNNDPFAAAFATYSGSLGTFGQPRFTFDVTGQMTWGDGTVYPGTYGPKISNYGDAGSAGTGRLYLDAAGVGTAGAVGINMSPWSISSSLHLDVNGKMRADTYYYNVTSTLQASSDERLKRNINPVLPHTEKILQLNPVDFEWSSEIDSLPSRKDRTMKFEGIKDRGLIAQEVQEIYPELVGEDPDGYLTVSYTGLIIPMLKTIQEQQKQIDELKKLISGE